MTLNWQALGINYLRKLIRLLLWLRDFQWLGIRCQSERVAID